MAPSETHPDWDSLKSNSYQTIDLTLSSPEPEPEPRRRPQPWPQPRLPQRQAQLYFGREPRPYGVSHVKMEASQPMTSARNPVAPQPARPINPEHIKQIINTADPRALQKVLLELCQVSPAFSGALVRGLAPHSTSAQGMISQHRMRSQQPKVKTQDDDDSDEIYKEAKRKLARSVHTTPNHSKYLAQSRGDSQSRAPQESHGSSSIPQVKREPYERSVPGWDGELHVPGAYPRTTSHLPTLRSPIRNTPSHSSNFNQTPRLLTKVTPQPTSIHKASMPTTKTCIVCHEPFVDVDAPCVSHSGRKTRQGDGSIMWDCCGEDVDDPGCNFYGQHVTGEEPDDDSPIQRRRPSASPGPSRPTQKRPRAF
jgi:hypothetical protein